MHWRQSSACPPSIRSIEPGPTDRAQVAIDVAVATSSNNLVKVDYAITYSGGTVRTVPGAALVLLAARSIGIAVVL
jgi:hypothetical protein